MIEGRPGLDVSSLVKEVLAEGSGQRSHHPFEFEVKLEDNPALFPNAAYLDPYSRLFGTVTGSAAVKAVGNESKTLDALSLLSIEVLLESVLKEEWPPDSTRRFLAVPGRTTEPPVLLILDPAVSSVSQSRRLTDEFRLDPQALSIALERIRPRIQEVAGAAVAAAFKELGPEAAMELMFISQPEVVVTRRPKMVPLCAPSPHLAVHRGQELSSAGIFCRDSENTLGVTACYHGTGPIGTAVTVAGVPSAVKHADPVQDIVFIPLAPGYALPAVYASRGVRRRPAPSEAEPVTFDGAGTRSKATTHVKSHDAGILRSRKTLQLKVQTPADTNTGDSGSALVDQDDRVVAFGFERTGFGEFPELTDWIWAANALSALGLTPI